MVPTVASLLNSSNLFNLREHVESTDRLSHTRKKSWIGNKGSEDHIFCTKMKRRIAVVLCVVTALVVLALIICLSIILTRKTDHTTPSPRPILPPPTAPPDADGPYREQVVAADAGKCSEIGRDVLKKKGSAVDAAVAALFCVGVINMHSAGVGGGGFMIVYNRSRKTAELIDFREEAPRRANPKMYVNGTLNSRLGGSASGVPGEVRGFYTAWKKYGKLPWKDVVQPAIELAAEGFQLGRAAHYALTRKSVQPLLLKDPGMRELLFENGKPKKLGQVMMMPKFARTLEKIRDDPESFYTGPLAKDIAKEIQDGGGIITTEDLKNYKVKAKKPLSGKMFGYEWYSTPPPGSGAVLNLILNILKGYNFTMQNRDTTKSSILTYHRIVEAFKYSYAYRALLGDEDYTNITEILKNMTSSEFAESIRKKIQDNRTFTNVSHYGDFYFKEDGGTSHLSLLAPNGDAVSATTTINLFFGSRYRGMKTGIIYNNEMDDFSTPGVANAYGVLPSKTNFIYPGKRPMSSTCPSLFVDDKGDVRLVIGASGGTRITSATSLAIMNYLWFNRTLSDAVKDPRVHHQLMPMYIRIDKDWPLQQAIQDGLKNLGHDIKARSGSAVVQAVAKDKDGTIWGVSDPRKSAWAAGV